MAKLQYVGDRTITGKARYYVAIDGTTFKTKKGGGKLTTSQAHKQAAAHSRSILADQGLEIRGSGIYSIDDGKYYGDDYSAALISFQSDEDLKEDIADTKADIEKETGEYKTAVERAGEEQEEYAELLSARKGSQMTRKVSEAILGTGGEAISAEFATERLSEASDRQLSDIVQGIGVQTKTKLADIEGMDITNVFNLEELEGRKRQVADAMTTFLQQQATERAGIQAQLDVQPEWWEQLTSGFGGGLGKIAGMFLGKWAMSKFGGPGGEGGGGGEITEEAYDPTKR